MLANSLKEAIEQDAATIRETDLDRVGGFVNVEIERKDDVADLRHQFLDRLGRVILPAAYPVEAIISIAIEGAEPQDIVRAEPRYQGSKQIAWVCYLAERETNVEEPAEKAN